MFLVIVALLAAGFESDPELKKGQALIEAFEYEKAADVFDALSQRPGLANEDKAVALVWLGLALAELREQARASVAFEDAVVADPLIVLPRDASPKIKALLDDARARVRVRPRAKVEVSPPPPTPDPKGSPPPIEPEPRQKGVSLMSVAVGTSIAGAAVGALGGAIWAVGIALREQAVKERFQSDAAVLRDQSIAAQLGGQVATGVGVAALVVGGALIGVAATE